MWTLFLQERRILFSLPCFCCLWFCSCSLRVPRPPMALFRCTLTEKYPKHDKPLFPSAPRRPSHLQPFLLMEGKSQPPFATNGRTDLYGLSVVAGHPCRAPCYEGIIPVKREMSRPWPCFATIPPFQILR